MKNVNEKNTKNEILDAYSELVAEFEKERSQNKSLLKEIEDKNKIVKEVKDNNSNNNSLDQLKEIFISQIDELKNKFHQEKESFNKLNQAIDIQKDNLENLHQVKAQVESLEALIITQKQTKDKFDLEMNILKQNWDREKEDYEYNLKIQRRNDETNYQQEKLKLENEIKFKKESFEKQLIERENIINEKEEEFKQLKIVSDNFEGRIQEIIKNTETQVTDILTKEFEFKRQLENKDLETEIKLLKLEIETLKTKVKEQTEVIDNLNSKSSDATSQVKEIALKAIENSGKSYYSESKTNFERANENKN